MKVGSRVRLKSNSAILGRVLGFCGWRVDVVWDDGVVYGHHEYGLVEIEAMLEPFPYLSHRTMAQVIADEQKPGAA